MHATIAIRSNRTGNQGKLFAIERLGEAISGFYTTTPFSLVPRAASMSRSGRLVGASALVEIEEKSHVICEDGEAIKSGLVFNSEIKRVYEKKKEKSIHSRRCM